MYSLRHQNLFHACAILFALALGGCSSSIEPTRRAELVSCFQSEFGFRPPDTLKELKCKVVRVGDTWGKWLSFDYEPSTFQRITNQDFHVATPEALNNSWQAHWSQDMQEENPNAPAWWPKPPMADGAKVFYREGTVKNYAMSYMYLWYDASKGKVYARSSAWE